MLNRSFKHFWVFFLTLSLFWPKTTFASNPPTLTSPPDNSAESKSPKLIWEYSDGCFETGSCFRVEIDDTNDFSSPQKAAYTNSFSYSPQNLNQGTWYWRVKAKDKTDNWTSWSNIFKFNLSDSESSSLSPSPVPDSSVPTNASAKPEAAFVIKDIPGEINSDQDFEVNVLLKLPNNPNQYFYLKGAFKKSDSINYFGETFANEWIKNSSSYSKQINIKTDNQGFWQAKIKVRPDNEDSGFDGTGNYVFRVGRYNDSGTGPVWSNDLDIKIIATEKPSPSPSLFKSPKTEVITEEIEPEEEVYQLDEQHNYPIKIASVAGEATMSNNITQDKSETIILEEKRVNWLFTGLGILVLFGGIGFGIYKFRQEKLNAKSNY